jgi:hypothetical protein
MIQEQGPHWDLACGEEEGGGEEDWDGRRKGGRASGLNQARGIDFALVEACQPRRPANQQGNTAASAEQTDWESCIRMHLVL